MTKRMIKASLLAATLAIGSGFQALAATFSDVPGDRWFSNYINYLADRQIIAGYPDNTFRPMNTVTRAEFASILAQSQNLPVGQAVSRFTDVATNHWASAAINGAAQQGWLAGYPDGSFRPNQPISTVEMYAIAAQLLPGGMPTHEQAMAVLQDFQDAGNVPNWAVAAVGKVLSSGTYVSEVTPATIDPTHGASRADVATVIAKVQNSAFRTPVVATVPDVDPNEPPLPLPDENMEEITVVGTLMPTVEAGGWLVVGIDGTEYLLFDLGNAPNRRWFREGAIVEVTGVLDPDRPNIYMQGVPMDVASIRQARNIPM